MRRIDDLSPLGDDNFALGHETPRSGPCLVHQSLPSGWVKQSSGFRRANSFPGAALREQFHDGGFEGLVEIIHYTSPLLEKHPHRDLSNTLPGVEMTKGRVALPSSLAAD
jgi:hypothetical protein